MANNTPQFISDNISKNKDYYSLYSMDNIRRCKIDSEYLGEAIIANENLIWHSIHKYCGKPEIIAEINGIEKDDIFQLGRMGFIKAMYAFDTERGIKFSSFAVTAIVREVRCYLRDNSGVIKLTRNAHQLLNQIRRIENKYGYIPPVKELSTMLDKSEEEILKVMQMGKSIKCIDECVNPNDNSGFISYKLIDTIPNNDVPLEDRVIDKIYIMDLIKSISHRLTDKELDVLISQIKGMTQTQTAKICNISQMRVSRILKKAAFFLGHKKEYMNKFPNSK